MVENYIIQFNFTRVFHASERENVANFYSLLKQNIIIGWFDVGREWKYIHIYREWEYSNASQFIFGVILENVKYQWIDKQSTMYKYMHHVCVCTT